MPTDYINKISKNCNIPLKLCEKFWEEAKEKAGKDKWGLVVIIFKGKCRNWLTKKGRKICDELK